jgi:hypothetical protein
MSGKHRTRWNYCRNLASLSVLEVREVEVFDLDGKGILRHVLQLYLLTCKLL